jgi:predicted RNA binding protein YcfA (HicA-like mRNA interferase family)
MSDAALSRSVTEVGSEGRVKVRAMIKRIEWDGWRQVRQRGSHRQFEHPVKPGKVTVPGHSSDELHPKTRSDILRQAGLRK